MSTKEKILTSALHLFNQDGIEKVTTRDIAKKMNISQGNLHYHFANKELIISHLFKGFETKITEASSFIVGQVFTKEMVLKSMQNNYHIMFSYRFFFREYRAVWRRVPALKRDISSLFEKKKMDIHQLIQSYQQQGILRSELSSSQVNFISDQFIFTISSWLTASEYMNYDTNYYVRYTFRIWLPYLSITAMKEWEDLLMSES